MKKHLFAVNTLLVLTLLISSCSDSGAEPIQLDEMVSISIPNHFKLHSANSRVDFQELEYEITATLANNSKVSGILKVTGLDGSGDLNTLEINSVFLENLGLNNEFWVTSSSIDANGRTDASGCPECDKKNKNGNTTFGCAVKCTLVDIKNALKEVVEIVDLVDQIKGDGD